MRWLQGPRHYVDLRCPVGRTAIGGVAALRELTGAHLGRLAGQEGFAGELRREEEVFHWVRDIDLQPTSVHLDQGTLRYDGPLLVEEGVGQAYVEHWQRCDTGPGPCADLRLAHPRTGRRGVVVRVGRHFGYARGRPRDLPPESAGSSLGELLNQNASSRHRQDLVDCEISLGVIDDHGWTITSSSLPFRENQPFGLEWRTDGTVVTADPDPDGRLRQRIWAVLGAAGDVAAWSTEPAAN
ncbi:hypothetical protein I6A84_15605 [Frankia sp. CNm7]|uniref:Uncharacterized protein n=1 Tax=Frankia nepalensis TaxID=1836974 RepID=A0A937UNI9_9ACTN|nr:hypothetical protein [Frankia nepalensis]MBL7495809.1 hypothetical protein [Frankia nepalensis]MBL7513257.1 hypothetical protein [Frankia nepalensis]MBL7519488.1 hypothetical protein [Frankia nepalensis]MBL7628138.1 hypothetical protein [Frankia nepalensis]